MADRWVTIYVDGNTPALARLNSVLPLPYVAIGVVSQQGGRDDADDAIEKDVAGDRPP